MSTCHIQKSIIFLLLLFGLFLCESANCQAPGGINQDVTSSIRIEGRAFVIGLENHSEKPLYLMKFKNDWWCYQVEIWDTSSSKVGYAVRVQSAYEAESSGAFMTDKHYSFHEIKPQGKMTFRLPFDEMAADPEYLEKVKELLTIRNITRMRPEIFVRMEPNVGAEVVSVIGKSELVTPPK